jgi:hypothetical protein
MKKIIAGLLTVLMVIPLGIVFSSAEATNIAKGMTYEYTGALIENGKNNYPDTDNKELTDGVIPKAKEDLVFTKNLWVGLNIGGADADKTNKKNSVVVDLNEVKTGLTKFVLYALDTSSGISMPKSVEVFVSDDKSTFTSVGVDKAPVKVVDAEDSANPTYGAYTFSVNGNATKGRYVKFVIEHDKNWAFVSEVEVYQDPNATPTEDPKPVEEVKEEIKIDGKLDDNGWKTNGWTKVSNDNARVYEEKVQDPKRTDTFDFQFRTDDSKLYVALKSNNKPFGTDKYFGNGKGTNFRLWFFTDGYKDQEGHEYTTYNYLMDFYYKSGNLVMEVKRNKTYNGNSGEVITIEGLEAKATGTNADNYWYVEAAIPFAGISATTGTHVYVTYSGPSAIDETADASKSQPTNVSWTYGNLGTYKNEKGEDTISWAYKLWDKENDVDLTFADLKLGVVKQEEPEFTDITGEKIADPKYELELKTTPEKYKAGDTITVSVTVKNIKIDTGLALIKFYLHYDATKVEPIVKNDGDNNVDMLKFIKKAPNTEDWKDGVCLLNEEESFYDISFFSAKAASNAKEDGSVVIEVQFKVKADAKGAIAFQIPHGEKGGYGIYNIKDRAYGNAGYVLAQLDNTKPGPSSSSTSSAKPSSSTTTSTPPTGDSGMYAIVIIAMLALAGAATIAVKKRSR